MSNMEESLDGSEVESNYSGISNEDFEEPDEDFEEPDDEPVSGLDEEQVSDAEGGLSTADAEDVFAVGNTEEVWSGADAEDAISYGLIRQEEADEEKFKPDGVGFGGSSSLGISKSPGNGTRIKSGVRRNKKPKRGEKFVFPSPYTGPRVIDGKTSHCYYCKSSLKFKSRLEVHIPVHFPPEYFCRECGKAFHKRYDLKTHTMRAHSEVKQHRCHLCVFTTLYREILSAHLAKHEKQSSMTLGTIAPNVLTERVGYVLKGHNQPSFEGLMTAAARTRFEKKVKATKKLPPPYTGPRQPGEEYFHCYYCPKAYKKKNPLSMHMYGHLPLQFFCQTCGYGFSDFRLLRIHLGKTHSKKEFGCHLCDFKTRWDKNLKKHVTKMHATPRKRPAKPTLTCIYCGWTSVHRCRLAYHMRRHRSELGQAPQVDSVQVNLSCGNCEYEAETKRMFHVHIRTKHPDTVLKCKLCDYKTRISTVMMGHLGKHTGAQPHACGLCGYKFWSKGSLATHMTHHNDETDLKCPECPFSIFSLGSFIEHLNLHGTMESSRPSSSVSGTLESSEPSSMADIIQRDGGGYEYTCKLCKDTFDTMSLFGKHLDSHNRNLKCLYCPYATPKKSILDVHVNAQHTQHVQFKCNLCDFKTAYRSHLKEHTNGKHTQQSYYKCQFCDFQSLYQGYLAVHERRHTGHKPYACDTCDYRCFQSDSLIKHKRRHTGERLFKCDLCGFSDFAKPGLRRHKRSVHSTERPFKCPFCGASFKTRQTAKFHERIHTGSRCSYFCSMCSYKSCSKVLVDKHMLRMHPETPQQKEFPDRYPNGRKKKWYFCKKCAFTTCSKPSLPRHMKRRHPSTEN